MDPVSLMAKLLRTPGVAKRHLVPSCNRCLLHFACGERWHYVWIGQSYRKVHLDRACWSVEDRALEGVGVELCGTSGCCFP